MKMDFRSRGLLTILMVVVSIQMAMGFDYDPGRVKTLSDNVDEVMRCYSIPGIAVAIVHQDEVVYQVCKGYENLEQSVPVTEASLFPLYSVSKIFASVYVFQCIERDQLKLHDPIGRHLADLPEAWRPITIHQLLSHQSGLPDILDYETLPEDEARGKVYADPILCPPGEKFIYNQSNYWLLQRLCQTLTGENTYEGIAAGQLKPAGISQPLFPDTIKDAPPLVRRYELGESGEMNYKPNRFPTFMDLAGGAAMSLHDFIAWNRVLDRRELLSSETMETMWEHSGAALNEGTVYGNGWVISKTQSGKTVGMTGGTHVGILKFPAEDVTVILLTNGWAEYSNPGEITRKLAGIAFPELASPGPAI